MPSTFINSYELILFEDTFQYENFYLEEILKWNKRMLLASNFRLDGTHAFQFIVIYIYPEEEFLENSNFVLWAQG